MTTRTHLISAIAEALGMTYPKVDSYTRPLVKSGWWNKTARGAGAKAPTSEEAAKLLMALFADGPTQVDGMFLTYARLLPFGDESTFNILRQALDIDRVVSGFQQDEFLDYLAAFIDAFATGSIDDLIWRSDEDRLIHNGELEPTTGDAWDYYGPQIKFEISGPYPIGCITFLPTAHLGDQIRAAGGRSDDVLKLVFMDQTLGIGDRLKADLGEYPEELRKRTARGVKFTKAHDGRVISSVAELLRGPSGNADG